MKLQAWLRQGHFAIIAINETHLIGMTKEEKKHLDHKKRQGSILQPHARGAGYILKYLHHIRDIVLPSAQRISKVSN